MDERASRMRVSVTTDGPYQVSSAPLTRQEIVVNELGESVGWKVVEVLEPADRYALCRCGESCTKPFCDGTHETTGFDGMETASHASYAESLVDIDGPGVRLHDVRELCANARHCVRAGGLWNMIAKCDDPDTRALAEEEAQLCPSGRYVICDLDTMIDKEPELEPSIALVEDPHLGVSGGLWVQGGIPVMAADGEPYEVRNRVTLCRCGNSANKPFCDGSHIAAGFRDATGRTPGDR